MTVLLVSLLTHISCHTLIASNLYSRALVAGKKFEGIVTRHMLINHGITRHDIWSHIISSIFLKLVFVLTLKLFDLQPNYCHNDFKYSIAWVASLVMNLILPGNLQFPCLPFGIPGAYPTLITGIRATPWSFVHN